MAGIKPHEAGHHKQHMTNPIHTYKITKLMFQILFEKPLLLGLFVFLGLLVLFGIWTRSRSQASGRALLAGLAIAVALFVIQALVETDREKLSKTVRQLSKWVADGDVTRIISLLDPNAEMGKGRDRDDFQDHLTGLLEKYTVQHPRVYGFEFELAGREAVLRCRSSCIVSTTDWTHTVFSKWKLKFKLIDGRWLITHLRPTEIAGQPYTSFWDIH